MTESTPQNMFADIYARLLDLRSHVVVMVLPWRAISESIVADYHKILDMLENTSVDVSDFRVPDTEIVHMVTHYNPIKLEKKLSKDKFVREQYFFRKFEALLSHFTNTASGDPELIGFDATGNIEVS